MMSEWVGWVALALGVIGFCVMPAAGPMACEWLADVGLSPRWRVIAILALLATFPAWCILCGVAVLVIPIVAGTYALVTNREL